MEDVKTPRLGRAVTFLFLKIWAVFLIGAFFWIGNLRHMDPGFIMTLVNCSFGAFIGLTIIFPFWIASDLKAIYGVTKLRATAILDIMLFQWPTWSPRKAEITLHVGVWSDKAYRIVWGKSGEGVIKLSSTAEENKNIRFSQLSRDERAFIFFLYGFERAFIPTEERADLYVSILGKEGVDEPKIVVEKGEPYWYLYASGVEPYYPRTSPTGRFGQFHDHHLRDVYMSAHQAGVNLALVTANSEGYDTKKLDPEFIVHNRELLDGWYREIESAKEIQ